MKHALVNLTTNLGIAFFLPLIIKALGASTNQTNYIPTIPYLAGMAGFVFLGVLTDQFSNRRQMILVVALDISAIGLTMAGFVNTMSLGGIRHAALTLSAVQITGQTNIQRLCCLLKASLIPTMFRLWPCAASGSLRSSGCRALDLSGTE